MNANDPVQQITFGQAMEISLNNYYDLLKAKVGNLGANEFLQLKLTADLVDITQKKNSEGGYEWFSYYNLLRRADLQIEPVPVSGSILTGTAKVSKLYGYFLEKLSSFVFIKELSDADQIKKAQLDTEIKSIKTQMLGLSNEDYMNWKTYCEVRGVNPADVILFSQWTQQYGNADKIKQLNDTLTQKNFQVIQIIDRQYADPADQEIVTAVTTYNRSNMQLCFPILPDYSYPVTIDLAYLLGLVPYMNPAFDPMYFSGFNLAMPTIKATSAGQFKVSFDQTTSDSNSIKTDWSGSGSVGYVFIHVNASASSSTQITNDFSKSTKIDLGADAAFRVDINYGPWFNENLFNSKYITDNPAMFHEFFGENGSLLYYPTALVLIRGFNVEFTSSASWVYDYKHSFSASAGGGFSVFGINFGGSQSYGQNNTEHQVDQTNTSLKFSDDAETIRFVGYSVRKNHPLSEVRTEAFKAAFAEI